MDVLVIGGSVFLGRAVVGEALAAGADVTVFNRGRLGARRPTGRRPMWSGDRTIADDLAQLAGRHFDVVVDTCGYVPAEVALSANLLRRAPATTTRSCRPSTPTRAGRPRSTTTSAAPTTATRTPPAPTCRPTSTGAVATAGSRSAASAPWSGRSAPSGARGCGPACIVGPDDRRWAGCRGGSTALPAAARCWCRAGRPTRSR